MEKLRLSEIIEEGKIGFHGIVMLEDIIEHYNTLADKINDLEDDIEKLEKCYVFSYRGYGFDFHSKEKITEWINEKMESSIKEYNSLPLWKKIFTFKIKAPIEN